MMDQKAINVCKILKPGENFSDNQKCFSCHIRSTGQDSFQDLSKSYIAKKENLFFGISPLHALFSSTKFLIFNVSSVVNNFSKEQLNCMLEEK